MFKKVGVLVLILIVFQGYRLVRDGGVLREVPPVAFGQCELLEGPVGAEDMTIDRAIQRMFISASDRRAYLMTGDQSHAPNGSIWTLDLSSADARPVQMTHDLTGAFHPHGIDLHIDANGQRTLYVINHVTTTEHEVAVFEVLPDNRLQLRKQISFPEMVSPNDLKVTGPFQFMMTNDHGHPRNTLLEKVEDYLGLPWSDVVYFDGNKASVVIDGLRMANGIQLSDDQKYLYVAQTTAGLVTSFERGASWMDWTEQRSIDVDSGVDNLEWDGQGNLLTGAHPKLFAFLAHMMDAQTNSPSQAIRMSFQPERPAHEILYAEDGALLSGSSVAVQHGDTLFLGGVFDPGVLRCR